MVNLWEDMETDPNAPDEIYAAVRCLKDERNKYEYDEDIPGVVSGRMFHSNVHYPSDYGFIPQTYYDGEGLFDAFVLVGDWAFPSCIIEAHPVALAKVDDDGEQSDKAIIIPAGDPCYGHIEDLDDIPQQTFDGVGGSLATYKNPEAGRKAETLDWEDKQAAKDAIEHTMDLYEENFA